MENKIKIAQALLDIARNSTTIFISETDEIIERAKKIGLKLPSPDLALFSTVYLEIDKPNKNGVIIPRSAMEKGLDTIPFKQLNLEHAGKGKICGFLIDAKIVKDRVEVIGVIFKSLFSEEMKKIKEKFAEKKLSVSFEIWSVCPETKEAIYHIQDDGFIVMDKVLVHGCGLLVEHAPACKNAVVNRLFASKEILEANKIVEKIFERDVIFASLAEKIECKKCGNCKCGGDKVDDQKKAEEIKPAEEKTETQETKTETKVAEIPAAVETKVEETPKVDDTQKAEEEKVPVEPAKEEGAIEKPAEEVKKAEQITIDIVSLVRVIREESVVSIFTPDEKGSRESRKGKNTTTREYSDGTKEVSVYEYDVVDTYTRAQLDEAVTAAKATKDVEIATLKAEFEIKLTEIKPKELEPIKAEEIVEEAPKVDKKEIVMEVGAVINAAEMPSETKIRAKQIDEIIAKKHQK